MLFSSRGGGALEVFVDLTRSVISLPSETQTKCSMAENEAMAWDVHFWCNLSIVTLFGFMKSMKTGSTISPKSGIFDDFTNIFN